MIRFLQILYVKYRNNPDDSLTFMGIDSTICISFQPNIIIDAKLGFLWYVLLLLLLFNYECHIIYIYINQ